MILWPAIDILDGKAVRLERGRFGTETVYDQDPLEAARRWESEGARALHVVDLDGARSGTPKNLSHVERIAGSVDLPVQVGGGLRTEQAALDAVSAGADRIVLGTAAYANPELLGSLLQAHGQRVVVSLDARAGQLAGGGWLEQTAITPRALIEQLERRGVRHLVYSSIERDGMLEGPDLESLRPIASSTNASLIYSGGVSSLEDLEALARIGHRLEGVIVGKALYERRFTAAAAQERLDQCTTSA